ncbi:MAG TPA: ABC transporter permease [Blastocatellia bacterium]|nr:ABC transporter permease [Blastocatellia bacterium]
MIQNLRAMAAKLRGLFGDHRANREFDDEIEAHLRLLAERYIRQGMTEEEAAWAARRQFGNVTLLKEVSREMHGIRLIETFIQDLRYGARTLMKTPGFTLIIVITLALGIGVNTVILSTVNGFLLRGLAVEKPAELISTFWGKKSDPQVWDDFSYPNYIDVRNRAQSFSGLAAWNNMYSASLSTTGSSNAGGQERAELIWGERVSGNYFEVMGVKPILGRGFLPEEDQTQNTHPVVVISHALWQSRFNAAPAIIGKTIYLNGVAFTVIGVAPETFYGSQFTVRQAFWTPLMMSSKFGLGAEWETNRDWKNIFVYGRLKPGVTMAQAEAELNLIADGLAKQYPNNADTKIQVKAETDGRYQSVTKTFKLGGWLAMCVAGLVLLVACANVANLMLARAAARAKEIGIRLAIGAGRRRIVRQLLTESLLLSLLGGALGWLVAYWGTWLVAASVPPLPWPINLQVAPDGYVLKWMLGLSLLTGVIFGLAPALLASRPNLVAVIKGDATGQSSWRRRWNMRGALVVAQVAISIIVLICAGLFLRSLNKALKVDPGFSAENLVTMFLDPSLLGYDKAAGLRFHQELRRRIEAQPGVREASFATFLPLGGSGDGRGPIVKEGEADPPPNQGIGSNCSIVGPKYFATMRTPLVMGREFTEHDTADAPPVVIVNQEFARKFYGSEQNALGKRFRFWQGAPLMEIVGIAKDGYYGSLYEDRQTYMFLPEYQNYQSQMMLLISANSADDLKAVVEHARREIGQMDARIPVFGVTMAEANLSYAYWGPRLAAGMAAAFGLLALLLATMGLYSVMTYAVSQRTREIGIRMALGAQAGAVLRMVVWRGLQLALVGATLGLAAGFVMTRVMKNLLFDVSPTDPATFALIVLLLVAVALIASYIPARRAAKVDPLLAIRNE